MPLRAVIFDFDGLILDTELPEFTAWCEVYEAHGQVLDREIWTRGIGTRDGFDPYTHLETLAAITVDRAAIRAIRRPRYRELIEALTLLDGAEERIDEAHALGIKVGLASGSDSEWVREHLDRFGLVSRFDVIKCASEDLPAKPDPALYLAVLRDLRCESGGALAFEDSPNGIAAAKAAGLYCIAVPNSMTAHLDLSPADTVVASLTGVSLRTLRDSWQQSTVEIEHQHGA